MLLNFKALIVILILSVATFHLARPIGLQFIEAETYDRRRNVWLALTSVAFLSPIFWVYALVSLILLSWAARRDDNPLALYVLATFTIPNASFQLPAFLINQLFDLTQYRILTFAILLPALASREEKLGGDASLRAIDLFVIASVLLQIVLFMPYESLTATMRRTFLFTIDTVLVVYAFSRLWDRTKVSEVVACFWLSCALMAPVAVFEWGRNWLLYTGLVEIWGDVNAFAWLFRGDSLRAQAATGHSINLGYILSIGLISFMFLRRRAPDGARAWFFIALLVAGIFFSGARSAWLTSVVGLFVYALLRPNTFRKLSFAAAGGAAALALAYMTPLKESLIDRLPFIGSAEQGTIEYRQRLFETSWTLIQEHPFFGDPFVYLRMESLRQGQGIIDIVNGYLFGALFSGFVGVFLQVSVFAVALLSGLRSMLRVRHIDDDDGALGATMLASLTASLFFVAAAGYSPVMNVLAGLLVSYSLSFRYEHVPQSQGGVPVRVAAAR